MTPLAVGTDVRLKVLTTLAAARRVSGMPYQLLQGVVVPRPPCFRGSSVDIAYVKVQQIPLYRSGIAMGDIVQAMLEPSLLYLQVAKSGGHSTLILHLTSCDEADADDLRALGALGCQIDHDRQVMPRNTAVGIDLPPSTSFDDVMRVLAAWETRRGVGIPWHTLCDRHRTPELRKPQGLPPTT